MRTWSSCTPDRDSLSGLSALVLSGSPDFLRRSHGLLGSLGIREARDTPPGLVLVDPSWSEAFPRCFELRCRQGSVAIPILTLPSDPPSPIQVGCHLLADAGLEDLDDANHLARTIAAAIEAAKGAQRRGVARELHLEIESASEPLIHAAELLFTWTDATPLEHGQRVHLRQAVLELLLNAAEWGHKSRRELLIQMEARMFSDSITIIITDQGEGFDVNNLPHAASPDDPLRHLDVREAMGLREGGFGLLISRGMMDELRHNESGNRVTLTKRFPTKTVE